MRIIRPLRVLCFLLMVLAAGHSQAQIKEFYGSTELAMNFQFAQIEIEGRSADNIIRWAPVVNFAAHSNYDLNKNLGFTFGVGILNTGFIASFPDAPANQRVKYRTYNLVIPIGFKLGNLHQDSPFFLFGGYEFELPFNYKQKTFENGERIKRTTAWFTNRTPTIAHSLFAGLQFRNGIAMKVKYYLTNFFNKDYVEYVDGPEPGQRSPTHPFELYDVHVVTFSLTFFPFQNVFNAARKAAEEEKKMKTITVQR